ncbi:MAG: hypothetical protein KBD63_02005 [Bacteriovoracaceae bacterium]|nr:hypothetical protein [Bacteriovoracaceae bacterium]
MRKTQENGQALFEFIIFLPFMLLLYAILLSIGGAINGSLNQQKAVRGYFYSRIKHNSFLPTPTDLSELVVSTKVGMSFIGWREYSDGLVPVAPCYKLMPLGGALSSGTEKCDNTYSGNQRTTQFIRVKTAYGVCSATYRVYSGGFIQALGTDVSVADRGGCETK